MTDAQTGTTFDPNGTPPWEDQEEQRSSGVINKAYPKFQLSKFLDPARDYQVVVRTDSFDELMEASKQMKKLVEAIESRPIPVTPQNDVLARSQAQNGLGVCGKCGAPNALSKKGQAYCSATCWLKEGK